MLSLITDDLQYCFWNKDGNISGEIHNIQTHPGGKFCMTCMKFRKKNPIAPVTKSVLAVTKPRLPEDYRKELEAKWAAKDALEAKIKARGKNFFDMYLGYSVHVKNHKYLQRRK